MERKPIIPGNWQRWIVAAVALLACSAAVAADAPNEAKLATFLSACDKCCDLTIKRAEEHILSENNAIKGLAGEEKRARALALKKKRDDLKALKAGTAPLVIPHLTNNFDVGEIGGFDRPDARAIVFQVLNRHEMIVKRGDTKLLLRGISTEGIPDDSIIPVGSKVFEVTGTYRYTTAIGASNTIMVLEPFNVSAAEAFRKTHPPKKK